MKIFLDTHILLDFFVEDRPASSQALEIFKGIRNGLWNATISTISIADCLYVLEVSYKITNASNLILAVIDFLEICPTSQRMIQDALNSDFIDKEDGIQYFSAVSTQATLIVTNDTKGFSQSEIPVLTPYQFIKKYLKK